jgi:hypothetical protein
MSQASRKGRSAPESKGPLLPSLRFYHSESLRSRTLAVLERIEKADDATDQRDALAAVVVELTESGLDYYFVKPVRAAKVGFMAEQSTKLGIASILRVMGPVARRIIGGMDSGQLRVVAAHVRHLMD